MIDRAIAAISGEAHARFFVLEILAAAAGVLILGGLWTPVAGVLIGMAEACLALDHPATPWLPIMLAGMGISLAMIGPGAWSIDARLYGRKQLLPPAP